MLEECLASLEGGKGTPAFSSGLSVFMALLQRLEPKDHLIEHRTSIEGPWTRTSQNLLRASIGLESVKDLIAGLDQSLSTAL